MRSASALLVLQHHTQYLGRYRGNLRAVYPNVLQPVVGGIFYNLFYLPVGVGI